MMTALEFAHCKREAEKAVQQEVFRLLRELKVDLENVSGMNVSDIVLKTNGIYHSTVGCPADRFMLTEVFVSTELSPK